MKIHLRQIPGEGLHLEGEEECPIADLEGDEITCAGLLHYSLDVGLSDGALWANGTLAQPVELTCVSCLKRFVHTVEVPAFAVHTELGGPEVVDLAPYVREDILLNLPAHPHCDRHGGEVCTPPTPESESADERAAAEKKREAAWGALDKLDL
jgi:uncharacterized metal-binding protein YceD (DUF177 family)